MTAHCATCNCADDATPPHPSTSSAWARRQALEAAAEAVRKSKERTQPAEESQ